MRTALVKNLTQIQYGLECAHFILGETTCHFEVVTIKDNSVYQHQPLGVIIYPLHCVEVNTHNNALGREMGKSFGIL